MVIEIKTETIKLDQLLKYAAILPSGGIAKEVIQNGEVLVNGQVETRRSKKLVAGDLVEVFGETIEIK